MNKGTSSSATRKKRREVPEVLYKRAEHQQPRPPILERQVQRDPEEEGRVHEVLYGSGDEEDN